MMFKECMHMCVLRKELVKMSNNTAILLRNDTAANWTSDNPVLAQGEMGLETDTNKIKFGDGSTAWNSLPYVGAGEIFKYGLYSLSANQTSNLAVGNHVEFNSKVSGSLNSPSTGSGQANGIITLAANKTYKITGQFCYYYTNNGGANVVQVYDRTNSTYLGMGASAHPLTQTVPLSSFPVLLGIFTVGDTDIDIDVRFTTAQYISYIYGTPYCWLLIEEYGGY